MLATCVTPTLNSDNIVRFINFTWGKRVLPWHLELIRAHLDNSCFQCWGTKHLEDIMKLKPEQTRVTRLMKGISISGEPLRYLKGLTESFQWCKEKYTVENTLFWGDPESAARNNWWMLQKTREEVSFNYKYQKKESTYLVKQSFSCLPKYLGRDWIEQRDFYIALGNWSGF